MHKNLLEINNFPKHQLLKGQKKNTKTLLLISFEHKFGRWVIVLQELQVLV